MEWTMYLFLLATLPGYLAANRTDMHFAGGSMMFEFIDTTRTPYRIKITTLTGWLLGLGPCGKSCSALDVGKNTTQSRQQILNLNGEAYFGDWKKEAAFSDRHKVFETVTNELIYHIKSHAMAVNIPMKWEQELAEVVIDLDPAAEYTDVSLSGSYWRNYTYELPFYAPVVYRLQIKVKPGLRGDTKKPNNSPQVLFKPVYKILLNEVTTIKLVTMDPDGDIVRCRYAEFVEAGGLGLLNNTVVNRDCSIEIDAQEAAGFVDGGWGAIPVVVMDIPKNPELDPLMTKYSEYTLSAINVQFMIQTLHTISGPEFVYPTEESQHEFIVYVGSTLKIQLYAMPTGDSSRDIKSFQLKSLPLRSFPVDDVKDDITRGAERVKYTVTKWRPGISDIGEYLISALVTDTQGLDGLDRNYNVLVKDMELTKPDVLPTSTGPYFSLFPHASGIVCTIESTCSFPIYTNTRTPSGIITSVKYTTSTFPITLISEPESIVQEGTSMFVTEVTVQAVKGGEQTICFKATDNQWKTSEIKCMVVQVKQDPCISNPCGNGVCTSQGQSYICKCNFNEVGKHCEKVIDFCASMPCLNNGTCTPYLHTTYTCNCLGTGYVGQHCEKAIVDCKLGVCGLHGVCKDLNGGFECDCYSGYTGDTCNITSNECRSVACKNGGICIVEEQNGVCKCPLGFSGMDCSTSHSTTQVNGGTGENPFTVPSLTNGAQLKCFVGIPCLVSLYSKTPLKGSPDIKVGLHSPDVSASIMSTHPDPTTDTVKSILSVTPHKTGVHTVCVNSGSSKPDTLCFKFDTDEYKAHLVDRNELPTFRAPEPLDRSIINCIRSKPCHAIFTTTINPILNTCTLFSGSTSAIVFKALSSSSTCKTNVLFNPPNTSDSEVCLYAGPRLKVEDLTFQGERLCFLLKTAETDYCNPNPCTNGGACILQPGETPSYQCFCPQTATGDRCQFHNPCLSNPCKNGGFCETHSDTYDCKCQIGFQGRNCDPLPSTTEAEFTKPTLNNGATVECEVGAKSLIPVFLRGPSAQLFDGPSSGNIDINLWKRIGKDGALHNEDLLEVTPQAPGNMKVCLKTQTIFLPSYQVICYHIKATRGVISKQNDSFKTPTLPAATTIPCAKTKRCHVIMFSQPDHNKCQQVEGQGDLNVHIFPSKLEAGSCVTDVLFSSDSATGLDDLCLRVGSYPQRCYKVDPNTAEPCKNQTCGDGACIVEGDNYTCVYDGKHQVPGCTDEKCVPIIG